MAEHAYQPGKFSDRCTVQVARYPCGKTADEHAEPQPYAPRRALVEPDPAQWRRDFGQLAREWEASADSRPTSLLAQQERVHARQIDDLLRRLP